MSTGKDNEERNTRILELAKQGKGKNTIARELGLKMGEVAGVLRRARDKGDLPRSPRATGKRENEPATDEHTDLEANESTANDTLELEVQDSKTDSVTDSTVEANGEEKEQEVAHTARTQRAERRGKTNKAPVPLVELARHINTEHELCGKAFREGLQHALKAGRFLQEAKDRVPHGQWLAWLSENCDFAMRTAQAYMRAARLIRDLGDAKAQRVALLPFRDALKELAEGVSASKEEGEHGHMLDYSYDERRAAKELLGLNKPNKLFERLETRPDYHATAVATGWGTDGYFVVKLDAREQESIGQLPSGGQAMSQHMVESVIPRGPDLCALSIVGRFRVHPNTFAHNVGPFFCALRRSDDPDLLVLVDNARFELLRQRHGKAKLVLAEQGDTQMVVLRQKGEAVALLKTVDATQTPWRSVCALLATLRQKAGGLYRRCMELSNMEPETIEKQELKQALLAFSALSKFPIHLDVKTPAAEESEAATLAENEKIEDSNPAPAEQSDIANNDVPK